MGRALANDKRDALHSGRPSQLGQHLFPQQRSSGAAQCSSVLTLLYTSAPLCLKHGEIQLCSGPAGHAQHLPRNLPPQAGSLSWQGCWSRRWRALQRWCSTCAKRRRRWRSAGRRARARPRNTLARCCRSSGACLRRWRRCPAPAGPPASAPTPCCGRSGAMPSENPVPPLVKLRGVLERRGATAGHRLGFQHRTTCAQAYLIYIACMSRHLPLVTEHTRASLTRFEQP